jgi:hypothetical protein
MLQSKAPSFFSEKGPEDWVDIPTERLTSLKKGEGYQLDLKSSELLELYSHGLPLLR